MNQYVMQRNKERLSLQHEDVKRAARALLDELRNVEQYLFWALDGEEKDGGAYYCQTLLDHTHSLVDQAHDFRAAVKANPPPKEEDDQ